jgi:chromosome segregation ATPase
MAGREETKFKQMYEDGQVELKARDETILRLEAALSEAQQQATKLESAAGESEGELAILRLENESTKTELEELTTKAVELTDELKASQEALETTEAENEQLLDDYSEAEDDHKKELEGLQVQLAALGASSGGEGGVDAAAMAQKEGELAAAQFEANSLREKLKKNEEELKKSLSQTQEAEAGVTALEVPLSLCVCVCAVCVLCVLCVCFGLTLCVCVLPHRRRRVSLWQEKASWSSR